MKKYIYILLITTCVLTLYSFQAFAYSGDKRSAILGPKDVKNKYSSWIEGTYNEIYIAGVVASKSYSTVDVCSQFYWENVIRTDQRKKVKKGTKWELEYTIKSRLKYCDSRVGLEANSFIWPFGNRAVGLIQD